MKNNDNTQIDIEDDDNKHMGKTYHDAVQTWNGGINRMKSESEAVDYGKDRTTKDITCKTDENSQHNGKIIKDVLPETAEDNKSNKSSKKAVFVMKAVAAVILLNAFLSMFLKNICGSKA